MLLKLCMMIFISCSLLEREAKDIVESKFAKNDYASCLLPKYYEMAILVMDNDLVYFNKFEKTEKDQTQKTFFFWHALRTRIDVDEVYKALMSYLQNKRGYLCNFCYLFIKIEEFENSRYSKSFILQEDLVHRLRSSFAKLKNYKILAYPINESVNALNYCFPYVLNIEYVHPLLQIKKERFFLRTTLGKTQYFMGIRPSEISDELYNETAFEMKPIDLDIIHDQATCNFFLEHIAPRLLKNLIEADISLMCKKLNLDISHLSGPYDEEISFTEYQTVQNLYLQFKNNDHLPNEIFYYDVQECLQVCTPLDPVYRFVIILILSKTKTLEGVYRSILRSKDVLIVDLFVRLMKDYGVITDSELIFIQARKSTLKAKLMFKKYYIEEIIRRIETSDGILMSDNLEDNHKFLILVFLAYFRKYKDLDMVSLVEYIDFICYEHVGNIYKQKQKINSVITKKAVSYFKELLLTGKNE